MFFNFVLGTTLIFGAVKKTLQSSTLRVVQGRQLNVVGTLICQMQKILGPFQQIW